MTIKDTSPGAVPSSALSKSVLWPEREILAFIRGLTDEKDRLRRNHPGRLMSPTDTSRLSEIESTLDQSWDLVRQRRARRASGQNWDDLTEQVANLVARAS